MPSEIVITKATSSAFGNNNLSPMLKHSGHDTQIMTGVYFDACFQQTIKNALQQGFNVYACLDATDCPSDEHSDFKSRFFSNASQAQQNRLHVVTTKDVLGALNKIRVPQQAPAYA